MMSFVRPAPALIAAAVISASGCTQSSVPQGVPIAPALSRVKVNSASPRLLYVSDPGHNAVFAFPVGKGNPAPVETIRVLKIPEGLAVDSHGDLFVAQSSGTGVLEFAPGSTTPLHKLPFPGIEPLALAVDAEDDLFVAGVQGVVAEYAPGQTKAERVFHLRDTTPVDSMGGITFDSAGNFYAALVPRVEKPAHVFKFAPGATTGTDLNLDIKNNSTNPGIAFDSKGNLYVGNYEAIDVFAPGSQEPKASIDFFTPNETGFFAIGNGDDIYLPRRDTVGPGGVIDGFVAEYAPGGSPQIARIRDVVNPIGAALSP